MSASPESPWAAPLGRVPSGIFILTVRHGDLETGMLASWVQQAGFEPPMVTVAVKQGRYVAQWLQDGAAFALNLVGAGETRFLKHFGRGFEPDQAAFEGLEVARTDADVPYLTEAAGYLACQPRQHLNSGDHCIFLAEVTAGAMLNDQEPMVHVRKSGLRY